MWKELERDRLFKNRIFGLKYYNLENVNGEWSGFFFLWECCIWACVDDITFQTECDKQRKNYDENVEEARTLIGRSGSGNERGENICIFVVIIKYTNVRIYT